MTGMQMATMGSGFAALSVSIPASADGSGSGTTIDTPSQAATVTGGSGSFSYSWNFVVGDTISAVTPSASSTIFRGVGMVSPETRLATFQLQVTDTITGLIALSNEISVSVERF